MASIPAAPPSTLRRALLAVGAIIALAAGASQLDRLFRGGLNAPLDFAAFWAAGHLTVDGENPYSGDHLRDAQASVGLTDLAVITWNPPWTLTLLMPFGAVPFRSAYGLWVVVHLALVAVSALLLWRAFDGPTRFAWVPLLIALTFVPTAFLIGGGQLTAVVLFGLAGFAAASRAERPLLAGAALALCATKPHLLVPLAVWLLFSSCRSWYGRRVLLGALAAGALTVRAADARRTARLERLLRRGNRRAGPANPPARGVEAAAGGLVAPAGGARCAVRRAVASAGARDRGDGDLVRAEEFAARTR